MSSPFLDSIRADIRLRGYSIRTEKTYLTWIKQFIYFINKRHPREAGAIEVKAFLTWLATERHVAINTQKVALNALVFLYHKFLHKDLGDLGDCTNNNKSLAGAKLLNSASNDVKSKIKSAIKNKDKVSVNPLFFLE